MRRRLAVSTPGVVLLVGLMIRAAPASETRRPRRRRARVAGRIGRVDARASGQPAVMRIGARLPALPRSLRPHTILALRRFALSPRPVVKYQLTTGRAGEGVAGGQKKTASGGKRCGGGDLRAVSNLKNKLAGRLPLSDRPFAFLVTPKLPLGGRSGKFVWPEETT